MGALLDLFRVLFSPTEVFERVRERPKFLVPALGVAAIVTLLSYLMMPFTQAAMASRMAEIAQQNPTAAAQATKFQSIGIVFAPITVFIVLLVVAGFLWLLVMLLAGGDAKYKTLLSVATYTALPSILLQAAGLLVLKMKGVEAVSSMQDLRPPLGLNLLAPNATGFMGALLAGVNPFAIWSMVLTAIGIAVTHKTSKGSAYTVAIVAMLLGLLIGAAFAGLGNRGAS
jgi:membrane protein, antimicrobial resistance system